MTITAAQLLAAPATPVAFVVDQLLPVGLTVLAGAPKTGKSYFALQASIAVAQGEPFLGRSTDPGDVLYLALEDGDERLRRRLGQLEPTPAGLDRVTFDFTARKIGDGLLSYLDAWHDAADYPKLVVIDTYGRVDSAPRRGQQEYGHVTEVLGDLQRWALDRKVAVVILHHLRKAGTTEVVSFDVFERILGSQGMLAVVDAALVMLRGRREHTAQLHVTSRDFEEDALDLAIDPETMRWSATKLFVDPLAAFGDRRREIVELLMHGEARLKDIAAHLNTSESNANQLLQKAIRDGVVAKVARGVYALDEILADKLATSGHEDLDAAPEVDELDEVGDLDDEDDLKLEFDFGID